MKNQMLLILAAGLSVPLLACSEKCGPCERCPQNCPPASACARTVECCEQVKVCVPVEKVKSRLVKTTCRVPKVHTKCVSQGPCDPPRQVTWTTYEDRTQYHWERYTVTKMEERYVTRCSEQRATPQGCEPAPTVVLARK